MAVAVPIKRMLWCSASSAGRYTKPAAAVDLMAQIKALVDPNLILNPYKVLPAVAVARHLPAHHVPAAA